MSAEVAEIVADSTVIDVVDDTGRLLDELVDILDLVAEHDAVLASCVLSSDGGIAGAPAPCQLLAWLCDALWAEGFREEDLRQMVHRNPAELLRPA